MTSCPSLQFAARSKQRAITALRALEYPSRPNAQLALAARLVGEAVRGFIGEPGDAVTLDHIRLTVLDRLNTLVDADCIYAGTITRLVARGGEIEMDFSIMPTLALGYVDLTLELRL